MMMPSHLLATLLLGLLLSRARPFEAKDWLLAVGFGVLIDLDHLLQVPRYVALHGGPAAMLHPVGMLRWGGAWQGFMHGMWAIPVVLAAALWFHSWLPPLFWGLHMAQDFVVARHFVHFGGPVEWAIVGVMAATLVLVLHLGRGETPFLAHAARTFRLPFGRGTETAAAAPPLD